MYSQDYDEQYVSSYAEVDGGAGFSGTDYSWRMALLPYIRNVQIFQCASYRPTAKFDGNGGDVGENGGYAMNAVHWESGAPTPPSGVADSAIWDASNVVTFTDFNDAINLSYAANTHDFIRSDAASNRHNDGANYAFYDGHVKFMKRTAVQCSSGDCMWSVEVE